MRVGRLVMCAALTLALVLSGSAAAHANPAAPAESGMPEGWQLRQTGSGVELTWQSPQRVPIGDAIVEFYAGDRLLGQPTAARDQRAFRLAVTGVSARSLANPRVRAGLQVRAGGRRLDAVSTTPGRNSDTAGRNRLAAQLPPNPVDPGVAGPYPTLSGEYALPDVQLPGLAVPVEMRGLVVAPQGLTSQRPLVLFLHGRHATCYQGSAEPTLDWPCPVGWTSLPSYRGFLRAQQLLASQGYVTVSISANGINAQDGSPLAPRDGGAQARSSLVRVHLGHWADWAGAGRATAPDVVRAAPVADLTRVLLIGHSRGGEGVSRAAVDSLTPPPSAANGYRGTVRWQIRGLALIGPTLYGHNPAPDIPSMVILPSCDGDVADLEGQLYLDATRGVGRGLALHRRARPACNSTWPSPTPATGGRCSARPPSTGCPTRHRLPTTGLRRSACR